MFHVKGTAIGLLAGLAVLVAAPAGATLAAHGGKNGTATGKATGAAGAKLQRAYVLGSLTSLSSSSISVAATGGANQTIALSANTRFVARSFDAATSGLKSGDQVAVLTVTGTNGTQAAAVEFDTKPFGIPVRVAGTVASSASGSLTVAGANNQTVTVALTAQTKYRVNGQTSATAPTFTTGERVEVLAERMTNGGGATARLVATGTGTAAKGNRVRIQGTFAGLSGTTLTVTLANNTTQAVQIAPTTHFIVNGQIATAAPAFTAGEKLSIVATKAADGTLTAVTIRVGSGK